MSERRIGVYGGTFDPIHRGHLEVARAVAGQFDLDEVLIVPAHRPPHKTAGTISDAYHRYAMTALATLDDARLKVSTVELEAPGRPYTFETMRRLREAFGPRACLFFVMGADSFEEINLWREPARILDSSNLVVISRPGHTLDASHLPARFAANLVDRRGDREAAADDSAGRVYLSDLVNFDISSTEIRRKVRDGEPFDDDVPPRVADYIRKYGLYRRE
ncbi:MAG TPA: nicotinate-nucleotide adenylyltransferase, partial [Blastocatellia bacterium]|nr:nicotinate-nucleotide adenylyltransferase [Blastocatellia bacterium]